MTDVEEREIRQYVTSQTPPESGILGVFKEQFGQVRTGVTAGTQIPNSCWSMS